MIRTRRVWEERFHPAERGWGILDIGLHPNKRTLLIAAFEKGFHRFELDANGPAVVAKQVIRDKNGHHAEDCVPDRQIRATDVPHVLAWNPKLVQLISAAGNEIFNYTPPREPTSYRVQSAIWCAAWSANGEIYAFGLENGAVSIRDRRDNELCAVHRQSNYPIWSLCWAPADSPRANLLTVADWGRCLSFYDTGGKQVGEDYRLDFVPLSVAYSADGQAIIACGADKKIHALSSSCAEVGRIAELRSWPLRCIQRRALTNRSEFLVVCADGVLNMMETSYDKCSHFHMGVYACRDALVNVSVKVLEKGRESVIPIQDSVLHVAVYRNLLAVATVSTVTLFRQSDQDMMLRYEEVTFLRHAFTCRQLLLAAENVLLLRENSIEALSTSGVSQHTWSFPTEIKAAKVVGGAAGAEVIYIATQDGTITRGIINEPFLEAMLKIPTIPVTFELNLTLLKIAIVGENGILYVYSTDSRELLFQEAGADSCAWNQYHPDMLAFSQGSLLKIKLGEQKVHARRTETPVNGTILGYAGSKVFYDTDSRVVVVDVPHTMLIHQSVEIRNFRDAYEIASFGASDNDWRTLGNRALDHLEFDIAKACFRRVRVYSLLYLIDELEQRSKLNDGNPDLYIAEVFAYRGRFEDAARSYSAGGRPDLAVKLFTDLRKFTQAEEWATNETQRTSLLELRADWAVKEDDKRGAVELFLQLGDTVKAIEAMKEVGWGRRILETARTLDSVTDRETIVYAAGVLLEMKDENAAVELFERIKDIASVIRIKLASKDWDYLLALSEREPFHREAILLPYAEYLVEKDRFTEARTAFARAGRPEESSKILTQLAKVAVNIKRFRDASFYSWLLGRASEESARQHPDAAGTYQQDAEKYFALADVYSAYAVIDATIQDPFSALPADAVFNAARILAAILWNVKQLPDRIRMTNVLYVLAIWAMKSEAYKTARIALERLKELRLPKALQGRFTEVFVQNRTRPFQDPQELLDFCHSCSSFNAALLNVRGSSGYACLACHTAFVYCPVSFEHLPLVEFHLPPDMSEPEAMTLISMEQSSAPFPDHASGRDSMTFEHQSQSPVQDPFFADFHRTGRIVVNQKILRALREEEVVVLRLAPPDRWRFFRNMLADVVRVTTCTSCWKIFNYDDFFAGVLELGCCPFCREPVIIKVDED
ncbi:Intraflagellar transport protein 122-like protein [Hypsibius exemplaris]|uniref:Intraflagellar transport protein 122-like protein n=1 Tax=Hypsibius exemplaris TaxID=2072580 RepID=A0A1W0WHB9_HYPEX|nr:Intraflagellar transport protein 122-like protein [Hypsibius exemplaris]